jgi:hypothetical protein
MPPANTDQGEFPKRLSISSQSPNPKSVRPTIRMATGLGLLDHRVAELHEKTGTALATRDSVDVAMMHSAWQTGVNPPNELQLPNC